MKLKKVLRIGLEVIYWGIVAVTIIPGCLSFLGMFEAIATGMCFGIIFARVIYYIYKRLKYKEIFNLYINVYDNLRNAHNIRYRYYIEGDEEKIKEYTELVDASAAAILYSSDSIIKNKFGKKKEQVQVKEIFDKTIILMTTIQPPV